MISTTVGQAWLYKFEFFVFPFTVVASIGLVGLLTQSLISWFECGNSCIYYGCFRGCCLTLCQFLVAILLISFTFCLFVAILPVIFEVFVFLLIAFYFEHAYMSRFPKSSKNDLKAWHSLISFMYSNKGYDISDIASDFEQFKLKSNSTVNDDYNAPYICTAKQDRIIRICCINYAYLKGFPYLTVNSVQDNKLRHYLQNERPNSFTNIIYYDEILQHSGASLINYDAENKKNVELSFFSKVWFVYGAVWRQANETVEFNKRVIPHTNSTSKRKAQYTLYAAYASRVLIGLITFVLGPLYILSRIFTFIFPLFIVLYLLFVNNIGSRSNDLLSWKQIDLLQWLMLAVYSFLVFVVLILNFLLLYRSYYESLILPHNKLVNLAPFANEFVEYVTDFCYPRLIVSPIRDYLVIETFGKDVGGIILSYTNDLDLMDSSIAHFKDFLIQCKGTDPKDHHFKQRAFDSNASNIGYI